MPNEAEGSEVKGEGPEPPKTAAEEEKDEDYEMVSEETPLVGGGGKKADEKSTTSSSSGGGGKSFVPVIKDEHEPAEVTTTEVTDEGVPPKNFVEVVKDIANNVGKGTGEFASTVGQKTKEITDHVGGESKKLTDKVAPHVAKFGENVGRQSQMMAQNVGKSTRQLTEHVGKESQKVAANVAVATRQLSDHVGRESQKVGQRTAIIAEGVRSSTKPVIDHVGRESKKLADAVGKETKVQYDKIAPIVEPHARKYSSLLNGTAPDLMTDDEDGLWKQLLDGTARSYGRVVLCDNSFTGALIGLAMLISSPLALLCSLICAGLANYTAVLIGCDRSVMRRGHYASNAVLVGSGVATYLVYSGVWGYLTMLLLVTFGAPVTLVAYLFTARILTPMGIPTLLFPYVGVMLFVILGAQLWKTVTLATEPLIMVAEAETFHFFEASFRGISQIFVLNNGWSGVLIFLGMITCSRVLATASLIGSILSSLLGMAFFAVPTGSINTGLLGFNAALSFPALLFFLVPTWKSLIVGFFGVFMTLGVQIGFEELFSTWSIPVMMFPFCFTMLPFVALGLGAASGADETFITTIPLADLSTPEEHFKRYRNDQTYTEIPDVDEEAIKETDEVEMPKDEEVDALPKEEEPKDAGDEINV